MRAWLPQGCSCTTAARTSRGPAPITTCTCTTSSAPVTPRSTPRPSLIPRQLLLDKIGLVDEDLPGGYGEDYEFLLRASRIGPVVCVPEPLTRIHFHDSSFFVSRWKTIDEALTYLLDRVPEFADEPTGMARIEGPCAFANAAMGERKKAVHYATRSLRKNPRTKHSYAALLVASRLVSADRVVSMARQRGRGI